MSQTLQMFLTGIWESLYMMIVSSVFAYLVGLPLGVVLVVTDKDGIHPHRGVNRVLGVIVNLLRSVPFLILLVAVMPFTKLLVGTRLGSTATIVPLVIAAFPFISRLVEASLKEVDRGVIEAALSMGASPFQIVYKVMLPEARPSLVTGAAIAVTTILSYSAMAGFVGGGGLGTIAINYGYYRYDTMIMLICCILLILLVQAFQEIGTHTARISDKRI